MPAIQKKPTPRKWAAILRTKPKTANKDIKRKHVTKKTKHVPADEIPFKESDRPGIDLGLLAMFPERASIRICPALGNKGLGPTDPHYFEITYKCPTGKIRETIMKSKTAKRRTLLLKWIREFFSTLEEKVYGDKRLGRRGKPKFTLHFNPDAVRDIMRELAEKNYMQLRRADEVTNP